MSGTRLNITVKKLSFFLDEIKALRDGGVWYFLFFGVLIVLLIPVLIFEIVVLFVTGKDFGWFQSSEPVEEVMELNASEVPDALHDLIPLAKKWGIGDDCDRVEAMALAKSQDLDELKEKVGPRMQEIGDWLSSYPDDSYSDTTYFFTYLMVAYEECYSLSKERNNE